MTTTDSGRVNVDALASVDCQNELEASEVNHVKVVQAIVEITIDSSAVQSVRPMHDFQYPDVTDLTLDLLDPPTLSDFSWVIAPLISTVPHGLQASDSTWR